jgi:heptose I phosphotransferase
VLFQARIAETETGLRLAALERAGDGRMWLDVRDRRALEQARLAAFDDVMATSRGCCLRVLADRENWYLAPADLATRGCGMYLKKHRRRTWWTRLWAKLGLAPRPGAGRVEARNARALAACGIPVMRVVACGDKLHDDGRFESFLLTEELAGYSELEGFLRSRFAAAETRTDPDLARLLVQVADIARRFHAAGYNHRDFNCYHFLVKELSPGRIDVRLIDLQRVQHRRWLRRRWIVKDLAQLASTAPEGCIRCREKVAFLRQYLGVRKLRPRDKRLIGSILCKQRLIQRRAGRKA